MRKINIAIDGPAGAGKSTVSKGCAVQLDYTYIDTGAMYRALSLKALRTGTPLDDGGKMTELLKVSAIRLVGNPRVSEVYLDGENVSEAIRTSEVDSVVSLTAAHLGVREEMALKQRRLAAEKGAVLDGRDIGTTILPDAELKIFLVASAQERALRRYKEVQERGKPADYDEIYEAIIHRDEFDKAREHSPLKKAEDAVEIDTTALTIPEVISRITVLAEEKVNQSHDV